MEAVGKPVVTNGAQARDVIVDVVDIQRDQLPAQERGRLAVGPRHPAPTAASSTSGIGPATTGSPCWTVDSSATYAW